MNDRLEKYVDAIRDDIEQNVVSWPDCERLAEAANLAEWVGHQVCQLKDIAKEQRFNLFNLYRCTKSDPLEVIKQGKIYRLRKWNGDYIVCGENFTISKQSINEYFERVTEPTEPPTD
jgi:hypothetical protein